MSKTIHVAVEIQYLLAKSDGALGRIVRNPVGPAAIRAALYELQSKGYQVVPPCENCDETGRCKGHPTEVER